LENALLPTLLIILIIDVSQENALSNLAWESVSPVRRPRFAVKFGLLEKSATTQFSSFAVLDKYFRKGKRMPEIFNEKSIRFEFDEAPIPEFSWHSSPRLSEIVKSKHLVFDITSLDPDSFSCPFHYHHNAEEMFIILSGSATLRTHNEFKTVKEGDIIFFEMGPTGAHQLYNHTNKPCRYLDCRTSVGIDICEYPDSKKINIIPLQKIYETETEVEYYKNEEKVREKWPKNIIKKA
jgi:uncharacterized cupin superfamily protein